MTTWVEGAAGSLFDVDNLPYGVFSLAGEEPRVGVRIGDHVLDLAPVAAAEMLDVHHVFEEPSLNPLMAEGPPGRRVAADRGSPGCSPTRPSATWSSRTWCRVDDVDAAPAVRGRRLRRLLRLARARHQRRPDLPPRRRAAAAQLAAPAGRLPRPRRHGRGHRHRRASGPQGQRKAPDEDGADVRPQSRRLDIEAELGFVVGAPLDARRPGRRRRLRRPRLRRGRAQRLVGARHPGVGVRPARARSSASRSRPRSPHWVTPLEALDAAWVDLPGQDPEPLPYLRARRAARARHRRRGRAQRRGRQPAAVRLDVLVARPDARPPDRQRRLAAHRRPVRLRHRSAAPSATSAARSSSSAGAARSRSAGRPRPSSRTATR